MQQQVCIAEVCEGTESAHWAEQRGGRAAISPPAPLAPLRAGDPGEALKSPEQAAVEGPSERGTSR